MGERRLRRLRALRTPAAFALALVLDVLLQRWFFTGRRLAGNPFWLRDFVAVLVNAYHLMVVIALFLAPPAVLERMLRTARPERVRRWTAPAFAARHPVFVHRVMPWLPGGSIVGAKLLHVWHMFAHGGVTYVLNWLPRLGVEALALALAVPAMAAMTRFATRSRFEHEAREPREEGDDHGAHPTAEHAGVMFAAVAVTPVTRALVGGLAIVSTAMALYTATATVNLALLVLLVAYVAGALGAATLFRRASRITVGIDGVLVRGAGKTRFYGYADVDEVKQSGHDILLRRRGTTTLRLQLHDSDVARSDVLVSRFRSAMRHAARMREEGAERLLEVAALGPSASRGLAASTVGGTDYRAPAVPREQLWQLVEGPASNAMARTVAAQAIAEHAGTDERSRLRIAAEQCAEPLVRVAIERILAEEDEGGRPLSADNLGVAYPPARLPG